MAAHTRQDHLDMINTPDNWPRWPLLPLKRPPSDIAFIYGDPPKDGTITIHVGGNIYHPAVDGETKTYDSLEALLDDGWVVD